MSSGKSDQHTSQLPADQSDERQPTVDELIDTEGVGEALKSDDSRLRAQ